jgi:hypothetical protein
MKRLLKVVVITRAVPVGISVLTALGCSGLSDARIEGNEASAIGSLRAVLSAQATYAAVDCGGLYAPRLTVLGGSSRLSPDLAAADVVERTGYRITLRGADAAGPAAATSGCAGGVPGFVVTAEPLAPGESGRRYFRASDNGDVVEATRPDYADAKPVK